jgi:hypothetical protein
MASSRCFEARTECQTTWAFPYNANDAGANESRTCPNSTLVVHCPSVIW